MARPKTKDPVHLRLNTEILSQSRALSGRVNMTLTELVEEGLRRVLARPPRAQPADLMPPADHRDSS